MDNRVARCCFEIVHIQSRLQQSSDSDLKSVVKLLAMGLKKKAKKQPIVLLPNLCKIVEM